MEKKSMAGKPETWSYNVQKESTSTGRTSGIKTAPPPYCNLMEKYTAVRGTLYYYYIYYAIFF